MDTNEGDTQESRVESVYERRQYHSSSIQSVQDAEDTGVPYNFVTFLATVQKFQVPLLHMTWQSHRKLLGKGATSQINEAQTSLESSFAFKRIPNTQKEDWLEADIYQQLITEISILRHPAFRAHPNVVELQGVCWDIDQIQNLHRAKEGRETISGGFSVWPVLVFETSKFGDLYQFAVSPPGRSLDTSQRLNICIDIGLAIADMQSYRIVHGDIKPQNVLISKNDRGFYPKVADFGYSVSHLHPNTRLRLRFSKPWVAPEYFKYKDFDLNGAFRTDVFSFGMLCLWLLFEKQLSGVILLADLAHWQSSRSADNGHPALKFLGDLKKQDALVKVSRILVKQDAGLDVAKKDMLTVFFERCLSLDPLLRPTNVHDSMRFLTGERPELPPRIEVTNTNRPLGFDMRLNLLLHVFYQGDYRVREHVFSELKESYSSHPNRATRIHLALCRKLAFGCGEGDSEQHMEAQDNEVEAQVETQLDAIRNADTWINGNPAHAYRRAATQGFHGPQDSGLKYRDDGVVETAERIIRAELKRAEEVFGAENCCSSYLKWSLSSVLVAQYRFQEAKEMKVQVMGALKQEAGPQHIETLTSMSSLCAVYQRLGQWKDAVDLGCEVVEALRSKFVDNRKHGDVLACTLSLGTSYMELAEWEMAEKLQKGVVDAYKDTLGEEHGTTMNAMETLAETYRRQEKWEEAEDLGLQIMEASKKGSDPGLPPPLYAKAHRAYAYMRRGEWDKAQELLLEVTGGYQKDEHPDTLSQLGSLAKCYWKLDRAKDAKELFEKVIKASGQLLGPDHPDTLERKEELASFHLSQGETGTAEDIVLGLLEQIKEKMGHHHPSTLGIMALLAKVYFHQNRYMGALSLQSKVLEEVKQRLGPTHPKTSQAMGNVASIFVQQGRYRDAESLREQALESMKSKLGEKHSRTLSCMQELAEIYAHRGRLADADELMHSCVQLRTEILGADHVDTKFSEETRVLIHNNGVEAFNRQFNDAGLLEITMDALLDAAESTPIGVLACLLRMARGNPGLCPEVVEAVAGNEAVGGQVMSYLFDEYGDEVEITEDVVDAAFWNETTGTALMEMFMEKRPRDIKVTTELLERAVESCSPGMMAFLLKKREHGVEITEKMIEVAASNENQGDDAVSALLEACPQGFQITTPILIAAAENTRLGDQILKLLLKDHHCKVAIGAKVLKAAAANRWKGTEMVSVLLQERGDEFKITDAIVKTAAHNATSGENILKLLFETRGHEVKITEDMLLSLVKSSWRADEVVRLLLRERRREVKVTETLLLAAARRRQGGKEMMQVLLENCQDKTIVADTFNEVAAANQENGEEIVLVLREKQESMMGTDKS